MSTLSSPRAPTAALRLAVWIGAGALVAALAASSIADHLSTRRLRVALHHAQVDMLLKAAARGDLREASEESVQAVVAALSESGMTWLGLCHRDGTVVVEAGERTWELLPDRPGEVAETPSGRLIAWAPPPPGGAAGMGPPPGGPPPGMGPPGMGPPGTGPPPGAAGLPASAGPPDAGAPLIAVIEIDPLFADELVARDLRAHALRAVMALALLLGALALTWLSRRADALAAAVERDRRLAALGEMSAVLAHELRNPLASLKGNAQLLLELTPEGRQQDRARWVVDEALRMEALTEDLLDFARTGGVDRRACDPAAVATDAAHELAPAEVALSANSAPRVWSLDPLRVHQALSNLLRNALQAAEQPPPELTVSLRGGSLCFEVRDHGAGLPPDVPSEALFEPFRTTRTRGTGLGLAVVQRVAELHGGSVDAANHPGGGAVFTIRIPPEVP